jgi:hypothetical protein
MESKETTNEMMYHLNDASKIENPAEMMRFMVMFFRIYHNEYFDIFKSHTMDQVHQILDRFDEFMRRSRISYSYKSELSGNLKTKEMDLIDAVVTLHSKLANLHLGFESISAITTMTSEQAKKLGDIRLEATETHHTLVNIAKSIRNEMIKITDQKVFFTEEEYPNYETKARLPTPTRRERRKKKHGH